MEKFFHLKENGTTVSTEIMAGLTTFFAMSYIIIVNPQILSSTGMPWGGVFLATIIAAIIGTLVMGLFANVPYAQAAGMGLNAFFTYTVCFGLGFKWQETLCMVFLCGLINIIITVTKIRKMIIQAIPEVLQNAIGGGIGLFVAYVGFLNVGFFTFTTKSAAKSGDTVQATPGLAVMNNPTIWLFIIGLVLAIIVGLVVFFTTRKPKAAATTTVTIGVTDESQPYWAKLKELAAKENITVQTKNFASYTEVNPALRQKQLDLNQFQHLLYLANYNVQNNDNIVPLGGSMIVPLGLYSKKHTSVDQIPQGGEIAIPNDPTNEARALLVLQAAGLLKLNGGGTALSTPADIDQANSKVKVTPVDAAQTAASLPSVDGSIVNNSFAADAKLDPSKALYKDDPNSAAAEPYINVFAVRKDDLNNPTYKRVVELYHEKAVADLVISGSNGTAVIVENKSQADLQAILDKLETQIKEKK